jgi:hypothetical protein
MSHRKRVPQRQRPSKALPALGAAGLSLSLASAASALPGGPPADVPTRSIGDGHEITLGEEEISDVTLATFYVFDKENIGAPGSGVQLVGHGHGCGGCRGCGGCKGCGHGCGGCKGCGHGCGHGCGGCGWGGCVGIWWGGCGGCGGAGYWCWRNGRRIWCYY